MNKAASGNRLLIKAICIALALTFGASFIATGVMANSGCGMKCCCLSEPMTRQLTTQEQIRPSIGCCDQNPIAPCDIASGNKRKLFGIDLACINCSLTDAAAASVIPADEFIDLYDFRGPAFDQFARKKFPSPPLYLQTQSFLI
jgi:hypothetical protein